ncbi:TlpA family protein disulfide reductase [Sphingobacterium humi]|uniref:Thioredoxin domain-containing protein n=1 Tax=Sphingobacterium humi TaxID=1796905 RepID=A0A6N8L667_9SPHI|nr:hypothetical protein [Sphingobacterium humi]MVZ63951.1 hypothetical protein [Sphingobacterium humi]
MNKVFALLALLMFSCLSLMAQVPKELPAFAKMVNLKDGTPFSSDSLRTEGPNVLVLYDPGCGHCQELGSEIAAALGNVDKKIHFYFIALQGNPEVEGYINMFAKGLKNNPQVHFIHDPEGQFILSFNPSNFPFTYIYDGKTKQKLQHFNGESKFKKLAPFLEVKEPAVRPL